MSNTQRIWPGPECLRTEAQVMDDMLIRLQREGIVPSVAVSTTLRWTERRRAEVERRTRGIGEGRAKARRRMERFLAWCDGHTICVVGMRHCKRSWSPEHAVFTAATAASINVNTGPIIVAEWARHWDHKSEMSYQRYWGGNGGWLRSIRNYLASPEWHSLPWQRDPEVAGG